MLAFSTLLASSVKDRTYKLDVCSSTRYHSVYRGRSFLYSVTGNICEYCLVSEVRNVFILLIQAFKHTTSKHGHEKACLKISVSPFRNVHFAIIDVIRLLQRFSPFDLTLNLNAKIS